MGDNKLWFWASGIHGVGSRTIQKLLTVYEHLEVVYQASEKSLRASGMLNEKQLNALLYSRNRDEIEQNYGRMQEKGILCIDHTMSDYPEMLRILRDYPLVIYVKGHLPAEDEWLLAVVGARSCSTYGRETARILSRGVAFSGISIVSGMARGIDSAAHWGAIEVGAKTYAVLGCGVDLCYPSENMDLYEAIAGSGGLISEFPPGTAPEGKNFPMRNRIIAALVKGILVIEARRRSGSLITVNQGLNMGKDIFAVPGRINDPLSEGCNQLIRAGAKAVIAPEDILEEYGILVHNYKKNKIGLDKSEKVVYSSMCLVPRDADALASMTGMTVVEVMHALVSMELKGVIRSIGKNQYIINI